MKETGETWKEVNLEIEVDLGVLKNKTCIYLECSVLSRNLLKCFLSFRIHKPHPMQ